MSKKFLSKFLFFGIFLFGCSLCTEARAATFGSPNNIATGTSTSTVQILSVDNIYYAVFSSSTEVLVASSSDGVTWSDPSTAFDNLDNTHHFDFKYNSIGGYFAVLALNVVDDKIYFTTSTDTSDWSSPVEVFGTGGDSLALAFAPSSSLIVAVADFGDSGVKIASSTNQSSWSTSGSVDVLSAGSGRMVDIAISGASGSEIIHLVYSMSGTNYGVDYASSTNFGASWTTTTIFSLASSVEFTDALSLNVNSSGLPAVLFQNITSLSGGGPYDVTANIILAEKQSGGSWDVNTIDSSSLNVSAANFNGVDLKFYGDYPYFSYFGSGFYPFFGYRGSDPIATSTIISGAFNGYGLSTAYDADSQVMGATYVLGSGAINFVTSSVVFAVSNSAPSATAITPLQTSATIVTVTTTVSDADGDVTNLAVEFSGNGSDWYDATLGNVTASVGSIVTSTGSIDSIDTTSTAVNLTIEWLVSVDVSAQYDASGYVRITPNDGTDDGIARTSTVAVDLANPTAPGSLSNYSVNTSTVVLSLPSTTSTDTNFSEYIIYYSTSTPVTVAGTAHTTTTDANLGEADFNSATTTAITSLVPSTTYYFKLYAYDVWGHVTSSAEISTTTLADTSVPGIPTGLTATAASVSQINLAWTAVSGATYYSIYRSTDSYAVAIATTTGTSYNNTGLSSATSYSYKVSATNGNGEGTKSAAASATTQSVSSGGGGSGYYNDTVAPANASIVINAADTSTLYTSVTLTLTATDYNSIQMMIANNSTFTGGVWETFSVTKNWTLTSGAGVKTIYAKFKDSIGNVSNVVSDSIVLLSTAADTTTTEVITTTTLEITPTSSVEAVVTVLDSGSKIIITPPVVASYQPGAALKFTYYYKNETAKPLYVRVTRQLINSAGKVVRTSSAYQTLLSGSVFKRKVNEAIPRSLAAGEYTVKIKIYNNRTNKLLVENSFNVEVEKLKQKYFVLDKDMPADTDIAFDSVTWGKIKSDALLPVNAKVKYSYTNSTAEKHVVRMVRELINSSGKVLSSRVGRWTMSVGEKDTVSFTQALTKTLQPGTYQIRLRAYDWTTKELLAENSFGFTVEFK